VCLPRCLSLPALTSKIHVMFVPGPSGHPYASAFTRPDRVVPLSSVLQPKSPAKAGVARFGKLKRKKRSKDGEKEQIKSTSSSPCPAMLVLIRWAKRCTEKTVVGFRGPGCCLVGGIRQRRYINPRSWETMGHERRPQRDRGAGSVSTPVLLRMQVIE